MRQKQLYESSQPTLISPYAPADRQPRWRRRLLGWFCLFAAVCLLGAAAFLLISAPSVSTASAFPASPVNRDADAPSPAASSDANPVAQPSAVDSGAGPALQSSLSAAQILALLATPPAPMTEDTATSLRYDPFTIISARARSKMLNYTAQRGDTIDAIAKRYGLSNESIAWCNNLKQFLQPGDVLRIPPEDGACHTVLRAQRLDISAITEKYKIDDPYLIIDSPANDLGDISPETLLPSNTRLFIPGGEGAPITWNAPVQEDSAGNVVAFDPGSIFSCGSRFGGGTEWRNPLPGGTFVRGFFPGHEGIDVAAAPGAPIYAANSGPILYAGWNNWGYGNTVVIGHGPFSTLYGHMSSIAAHCGQTVNAGQVIGYVGSTGRSSGPHLHFEVRYRNEPRYPDSLGISW